MTSEEVIMLLYDYCRWSSCAKVEEYLKKYSDNIDLTYDEGRMFRAAILRNSPDLLNILLSFYKETQLKGDIESVGYKKANYMLRSILKDAEESLEITADIYKVIEPYLSAAEGENEQDLSGFDGNVEDFGSVSTLHKSSSAPNLIQHQSVGLLHNSSESLVSELNSSGSSTHSTIMDNLGQASCLLSDIRGIVGDMDEFQNTLF